jgi:PAS domain S-box-containing protein
MNAAQDRFGMKTLFYLLFQKTIVRYLSCIAAVGIAFALRIWLIPLTGTGAPFVLFFAAILVTSLFSGVGPGICAVLLSMPLAAYTFVVRAGYPVFQAAFQSILFAVDGGVVVYLTHLMQQGRHAAQEANRDLRSANEEVTRSVARTREIIELAPDAFFQANLNACFTDVNQAACRMLGYGRDELLDKTVFDIIPAEDAPRMEAVKADLLTPERVDKAEWILIRKNGTFVPVEVSSNILPDGRWQAFVRDISERKRAEEEREHLLAREHLARQQAETANEQLRESEERFRLTIDDAPIGMALVSLDGRFVRVNRVLCEIVGYRADELTSLTFQAITHPDDLETDVVLAGRLARGEIPRYQLEKRYIRKDGSIVDIMLSSSILRGPDDEPLYYIVQIEDIAERKRLEQELRLSEAKSSGIVSISADAIISIDADQRITLFNEGAEKIFGYPKAEVIGAPLDILIPERFRAIHREHVAGFAAGQATARRMGQRETAILGLRKNGEEFPADAAISKLEVGGKRIMTVALRDITDQKRIEDEQRFLAEVGPVLTSTLDYEETLRNIAQLAVRDLADFCIVDVVEEAGAVRRLKALSRDFSKAWVCDLFMQVPLDPSHRSLVASVLENRQTTFIPFLSPESIASFSEETLKAVRAADLKSVIAVPLLAPGKLVGIITFLSSAGSRVYGPRDVRLAEELAQRATLSIENARLFREAQRAIKTREDVLAIVSHDLGNPLANIELVVHLFQRTDRMDTKQVREFADKVKRSVDAMKVLIADLLDFARIQSGTLSVVPSIDQLSHVMMPAIDRMRALAEAKRQTLEVDLPSSLPHVAVDADRISQVVSNLVGNAIKFTPHEGTIRVSACQQDHQIVVCVADTGPGIPQEDLSKSLTGSGGRPGQGRREAAWDYLSPRALFRLMAERSGPRAR